MSRMRLVDRETLGAVAAEFLAELEGLGLTFPHGIAEALSVLDGRISPQTAARLRKEAGVRQFGDPWERLRAESLDELARLAQSESVEVAAVMLSKLGTARAAELLGRLPGALARQITYMVSQTSKITPQAVDRIGLALAAQLAAKPPPAFDEGAVERIGEILNVSKAATREEVLDGLEQTDAELARQVRKALFTFAHLPERIDGRDAAQITRAVDEGTLVNALAYASRSEDTAEAAEFLLGNISSRLADNLREMVEAVDRVSRKDGEAALNAVVVAARDLAESGAIRLLRPGEDDDE